MKDKIIIQRYPRLCFLLMFFFYKIFQGVLEAKFLPVVLSRKVWSMDHLC